MCSFQKPHGLLTHKIAPGAATEIEDFGSRFQRHVPVTEVDFNLSLSIPKPLVFRLDYLQRKKRALMLTVGSSVQNAWAEMAQVWAVFMA
jgi:hypothetical protein